MNAMFKLGFSNVIKSFMKSTADANMPFPNQDWAKLKDGSKNMTYRTSDETGKYKVGKKYRATSYNGRDLNIDVLITSVSTMDISKVPPERACRILRDDPSAKTVEEIKFKIL